YPYGSGRTATVFNESEVLARLEPSVAFSGGTIRVYATDEHAPLLGVRDAANDGSVTALNTTTRAAHNPSVGDKALADGSGRPFFPVIFVTDITFSPSNTSGDWQILSTGQTNAQKNATGISPTDVFGVWKGATKGGPSNTNNITTDADPASNVVGGGP